MIKKNINKLELWYHCRIIIFDIILIYIPQPIVCLYTELPNRITNYNIYVSANDPGSSKPRVYLKKENVLN